MWYKFFDTFLEEGQKLMMEPLRVPHDLKRIVERSRLSLTGQTRGNRRAMDPNCKASDPTLSVPNKQSVLHCYGSVRPCIKLKPNHTPEEFS
ncbi:hypothetical protein AVEN_169467-1 [Araneus ventricosus]|uniref:Uncharacterized protein n=1 Tax=Araneus ventricosus TaxID=182803 RepID=A0A4Y2PXG6_ARAVE|nr:hypothetical protein AVEN_169467-1 [Araneus ventricosus]